MGDRNRLFISYSHKDTKWLQAERGQEGNAEPRSTLRLLNDVEFWRFKFDD